MLTRRAFLRESAVAAAAAGLGGRLLEVTALGSTGVGKVRGAGNTDRVLVTVNLDGGNDLLNTVVPVREYGLYRDFRPTLGVSENDLLPLPGTSDFALNPRLVALHDLYAEGKVAIVNGVGPPPSALGLFDHEASQINFQAAHTLGSATTQKPTGWLGRYLDRLAEGPVSPGINFHGGNVILRSATRDPLAINAIDDFGVVPSFDTAASSSAYRRILGRPREASAVAEQMRLEAKRAVDQADFVRQRTGDYTPGASYPGVDCGDPAVTCNPLALSLLDCAKLIVADIGARVLATSFGGFDTHAGQNDGEFHDYLLGDVADAIGAFVADLEAHGVADRVIVLVFTEFGRRPEENTNGGTDHGFGGGMFVIGNRVTGGFYGDYPSLAPGRLVLDGNLDVTVDFRRVYATLLERHLGADPVEVLGGSFEPLPFL